MLKAVLFLPGDARDASPRFSGELLRLRTPQRATLAPEGPVQAQEEILWYVGCFTHRTVSLCNHPHSVVKEPHRCALRLCLCWALLTPTVLTWSY